jgi:hypothetical protein
VNVICSVMPVRSTEPARVMVTVGAAVS